MVWLELSTVPGQSQPSSVITPPFEYQVFVLDSLDCSIILTLAEGCKNLAEEPLRIFFREFIFFSRYALSCRKIWKIYFNSRLKVKMAKKNLFSPLGKSNKGLCIKRNEKHRRGVYKGIRFRLFRVCTWKTSETHCRGVKAQISKLACMTIVEPPRRTFEAVKGMCSANALHDSRVSRPGKA